MKFALFLLSAALSGAASLAYEVAWTHPLALAVGGSSVALAGILATFLLGMAAGAGLASRFRVGDRPLLQVSVLLAGAGALGWAWPGLARSLPRLLRTLAEVLPVDLARILTTQVALLPSALLMGATFPLWISAATRWVPPRRAVALIYGVQVLGGAVGALCAGYAVVPNYGFAAASRAAGALDLTVAALAALAASRFGSPSKVVAPKIVVPTSRRFTLAFLIAGFAALGYQVVWSRALVFFLDGLHHAFTAVLTAVLLGLALGGLLIATLAQRIRDPRAWLTVAQLVAAVLGIVTWYGMPWLGEPATTLARSADAYSGRLLILAIGALTLPATVLGVTFPLVVWIAVDRHDDANRALAGAYGITALGNALAAVTLPWLLIPILGLDGVFAVLVGCNSIAALLLATRRVWFGIGFMLLALAIAATLGSRPKRPTLLEASAVFSGRRAMDRHLASQRDGSNVSVAVVEDYRRGTRSLYTDTFSAAATGRDNHYMRLLAHVPALLASSPANALVVCFGTGTTAGSLALHPEVAHLRVVDLEREVFRVAPAFEAVNRHVLSDPRVQEIVRDGRLDLLLAERPLDLVTLEPLLPYTQGAATFYTREFHELVRSRLAPGGTYCHWIPVHVLPEAHYRALVKTFFEVFPEGSLFFFEQSSLLFAREGPEPTYEEVAARARANGIPEDLQAALVQSLDDLLAARVAYGPTLRAALRDAQVMSDDHPFVAFPKRRPESLGFQPLFTTLAWLRERLADEVEARPLDPLIGLVRDGDIASRDRVLRCREVRAGLLEARLAEIGTWLSLDLRRSGVGDPVLDVLDRVLTRSPDHLEARRLRDRRAGALGIARGRSALESGDAVSAFATLRSTPVPERAEAIARELSVGLAALALGDPESAARSARTVLDWHPRELDALMLASVAAARLGDGGGARSARLAADALDPDRAIQGADRIANVLEACGAVPQPLSVFRRRFLRAISQPLTTAAFESVLGVPGFDPRYALLAEGWLIAVTGSERHRGRALIGLADSEPELASGWSGSASSDLRADILRSLAALPPTRPDILDALSTTPDPECRRLLVIALGERGSRERAGELLRFLDDADGDVRLYADRALRQLTGRSVDFDYAAPPDGRKDAIARWRSELER